MKALQNFLETSKKTIDDSLQEIIEAEKLNNFSPAEQKLWEAMNYALNKGGKRIRPILGLLIYEVFTQNPQNLEKFQKIHPEKILKIIGALELVHASSLIYDDLPCMDHDFLRRGQPTTWKKYGESTAILTAISLNNLAFEILSKNASSDQLPDLTEVLSQSLKSLSRGQSMDLDFQNSIQSIEDLEKMHAQKTGALLEASVQFGIILAQVPKPQSKILQNYAQKIGLAFQIKDDLLDAEGSESQIGKKSIKDLDKKGFVAFLGLEQTKLYLEKITVEAQDLARQLDSELLEMFATFMLSRKY